MKFEKANIILLILTFYGSVEPKNRIWSLLQGTTRQQQPTLETIFGERVAKPAAKMMVLTKGSGFSYSGILPTHQAGENHVRLREDVQKAPCSTKNAIENRGVMMYRSNSSKGYSDGGQGLVEYSLLLALFAVVVIAVLVILGPNVGDIYSQASEAFNEGGEEDNDGEDDPPVEEITDVVALSIIDYTNGWLHLHATTDGVSDPSVTMTADPGGPMTRIHPTHYTRTFLLPGPCPCVVTVTSSEGGSATITVP